MRKFGSDAGCLSSVSNFPFHTWCFNAAFTVPKVRSSAASSTASLVLFFPRHASCVFSRIPCPFASLMLILSFVATFCNLDASYEQLATSVCRLVVMLLTYLVKCLYMPSQCCNILYTAISYNILVRLYMGTRKANTNYNAFVTYRCHKPLVWL